MGIRREQNKIAKEFFKRLKKNFDTENLVKHSSKRFDYESWEFHLVEYDMWFRILRVIRYNNCKDNDIICIRPRGLLRFRIKNFILWYWEIKQREKKRETLLKELNPSREAIEESFGQDAIEIYESLK